MKAAVTLALMLFLFLAACRPPRVAESPSRRVSPRDGRVVLVTFDSLPVAAVAATPQEAPNFSRLVAEADWSGIGVAASSRPESALASLHTGLGVWHQGVFGCGHALSQSVPTLAEVLGEDGYRTEAWVASREWIDLGLVRGFSRHRVTRRARRIARALEDQPLRDFLWAHLPGPTADSLELSAEGASHVSAALADADARLGVVVGSLEPDWDSTLLIVAAASGFSLDLDARASAAPPLSRERLEVPLVVKLPRNSGRTIAAAAGERVAVSRLWATIVEAAGLEAPPLVAASLFQPSPPGILSELLLANGSNSFSWLEGETRLLWQSRFAMPEVGSRDSCQSKVNESQFARTPPLSGDGSPIELHLERWQRQGTVPFDDPTQAQHLKTALAGAFLRGLAAEETPRARADRESSTTIDCCRWLPRIPGES